MHQRKMKILGIGRYLPKKRITSESLEEKLGLEKGWIEKGGGAHVRYFVEDETASQMGAIASREALKEAGLEPSDIDCIVCGSGVPEQIIPCTASLIQKELGLEESGIPSFDINSTCLGFVTSLDLISYLIDTERYRHVLLVVSDIASAGLDWEHMESCTLFGDGAAAVVLSRGSTGDTSKVIGSHMETYSKGSSYTEIRAGGTKCPGTQYTQENKKDYLFHMDGKKAYKILSQTISGFVERTLSSANLSLSDIDFVIPHQASYAAIKIIQKKLGVPDEKYIITIQNHGNTIAASIPFAFYETLRQGKIKRGNRIMFLGFSAGISLGAVILEY